MNQLKTDLSHNGRDLLLHENRLHIPNSVDIKWIVMDELHKRLYSGHPGHYDKKMITMIRKGFVCPNMKNEVEEYLPHCIEFQQVKA